MGKKPASGSKKAAQVGKPSALVDTRVIYCGDNLEQLKKFPDECIDLIYIDPPFNSNRNYEVFWGETKEKRAFEDRHASTQLCIDLMREFSAQNDVRVGPLKTIENVKNDSRRLEHSKQLKNTLLWYMSRDRKLTSKCGSLSRRMILVHARTVQLCQTNLVKKEN
jgi:hypothetical protein